MKTSSERMSRRKFVDAVAAGAAGMALCGSGVRAAEKVAGKQEKKPQARAKKVLLIVGENFEELEFAAYSGVLSWTRAYSFTGTPVEVTVAGFSNIIGGMGSMRIVPDVLVADLKPADVDQFDAVAIPCSVGAGRGRRTYKGQEDLVSQPVLDIVRRVHDRGGVIATMCCSRETVVKAGLLKESDTQCRYWSDETGRPQGKGSRPAPIVVANRIITTMGPAVSWPAVVLLVELLNGREQAAQFTKTCPWVFGQSEELVLKVPVLHAGK